MAAFEDQQFGALDRESGSQGSMMHDGFNQFARVTMVKGIDPRGENNPAFFNDYTLGSHQGIWRLEAGFAFTAFEKQPEMRMQIPG